MSVFVGGTDTGIGKTYFTALATRALRASGVDAVALKPICCGDRADVECLGAAADHALAPNVVNPVWLREAAAPLVAARLKEREIREDELVADVAAANEAHDVVLVEGAGGWKVPLAPGRTLADFAARLALPVVLVAPNRLGVLNHVLLTVESIASSGLELAGIVLNEFGPSNESESIARRTNRGVLERDFGLPVWTVLCRGQEKLGREVVDALLAVRRVRR